MELLGVPLKTTFLERNFRYCVLYSQWKHLGSASSLSARKQSSSAIVRKNAFWPPPDIPFRAWVRPNVCLSLRKSHFYEKSLFSTFLVAERFPKKQSLNCYGERPLRIEIPLKKTLFYSETGHRFGASEAFWGSARGRIFSKMAKKEAFGNDQKRVGFWRTFRTRFGIVSDRFLEDFGRRLRREARAKRRTSDL